jgi:glycosyltransferase involved in cell wall biosynthesis
VTLPTHNLYSPWQTRPTNPYVRAAWHLIEDRFSWGAGFDHILREFQPDVLHTNSLYGLTASVWAKAKARGVPIVHTLHDYYLICARSNRFKKNARCQSTCLACSYLTVGRRGASVFVDTIVSVSERILAIHKDCGMFEETEHVIIRNPPPNIKGAVAPVQSDGRKVTFGFIGRPSVEKGIIELLSAFRKMPKGLCRLLIAGDADPEMRAIIARLAKDTDCELVGFVNPDIFFRSIDVMIIPSIWEDPCPMVIGESFAYARSVVGARRGGIPELISELSGWLYEPGTGELDALLLSIANDKTVASAKSQYLLSNPNSRNFDDLVAEYTSVYKQAVTAKKNTVNLDSNGVV